MRILVLSDAGPIDGILNLESEAQVAALCRDFWADDPLFDVLSKNPLDTAARHDVHSLRGLDFTGAEGELGRIRRRQDILSAAGGTADVLQWDDPAWQVIQAVAASDLVLFAGGTISSAAPQLIFEWATMLNLAFHFGKPLFIGALSVGPLLEGTERQLVADVLRSCLIVGARDAATFDLLLELGIDRNAFRRTVDDAAFLGIEDEPVPSSGDGYVVAALSPETGTISLESFARSLAVLLDHTAKTTELRVVVPRLSHATAAGRGHDLHRAILKHTTSPRIESVEVNSVADAANLARGAELVIASEYEFAVFAAAAGVPTVGVVSDDFSDRQVSNALEDFGQFDTVLPALALGTADATGLIDDVWAGRTAIRTAGLAAAEIRRAEKESWWRQPKLRLGGVVWGSYDFARIGREAEIDPVPVSRMAALRERMRAESTATNSMTARALAERVVELEHELGTTQTQARAAIAELENLRMRAAELDAENRRLAERSAAYEAELRATLATKTFRYSDRLRKVYQRIRR